MSNALQVTGLRELQIKFSNRKRDIRDTIRQWMRQEVKPMVFEDIEANFHREAEGSTPWPALSQDTIEDRLRKGYPGSRPKLRRTGELLYEALGKKGNMSPVYSEKVGEAKLAFGLQTPKAFSHVEGKGKPGVMLPKRNFMFLTNLKRYDIRNSLSDTLGKFMLK